MILTRIRDALQYRLSPEDLHRGQSLNNSTALDWAALVAVALALIHLAAPLIRGVLAERAATLGIFGSGMAISYVFIHLFNEIDAGHKLLGNRIHLVMLVGFFATTGWKAGSW